VGNYGDDVARLGFASQYKQLYIHTIYRRRQGELKNQFWTALGAVRTSAFDQLEGFSSRFPGALGEDTEFGQRLTDAGYGIVCCPAATGLHHKVFTVAGLIENDLRKGKSALEIELGEGRPVLDNRHTSVRDIAAVGLLGLCCPALVALLISVVAGASDPTRITPGVALACCAVAYGAARSDLLGTFYRQGPIFGLRSTLLMVALDLVRGWTVARALPGLALRKRRLSAPALRTASASGRADAKQSQQGEWP
jgi:hypothetical protein